MRPICKIKKTPKNCRLPSKRKSDSENNSKSWFLNQPQHINWALLWSSDVLSTSVSLYGGTHERQSFLTSSKSEDRLFILTSRSSCLHGFLKRMVGGWQPEVSLQIPFSSAANRRCLTCTTQKGDDLKSANTKMFVGSSAAAPLPKRSGSLPAQSIWALTVVNTPCLQGTFGWKILSGFIKSILTTWKHHQWNLEEINRLCFCLGKSSKNELKHTVNLIKIKNKYSFNVLNKWSKLLCL